MCEQIVEILNVFHTFFSGYHASSVDTCKRERFEILLFGHVLWRKVRRYDDENNKFFKIDRLIVVIVIERKTTMSFGLFVT
jgi:hypothetical protein